MSAYEELIEECVSIRVRGALDGKAAGQIVEEQLAEIRRTLETVTPQMVNDVGLQPIAARAVWLAMLHASPLEPPK